MIEGSGRGAPQSQRAGEIPTLGVVIVSLPGPLLFRERKRWWEIENGSFPFTIRKTAQFHIS